MSIMDLKNKTSDVSSKIKELELKKNSLVQENNDLKTKVDELERKNRTLEEKLEEKSKSSKELEQEKLLLDSVVDSRKAKTRQLEESSSELEKKLSDATHKSLESDQEKFILQEIVKTEKSKKHQIQKKYYISIALAGIILSVVTTGFFYYESVKNSETEQALTQSLRTKEPLIQNLKGDVLDTWMAWRKAPSTALFVNIINAVEFPRDKVDVVKNAILSEESIELDDSLLHKGPKGTTSIYYKGWKGALEKAAQTNTEFYIPTKIEVLENNQMGDVEIELTNNKDSDGYSGYTNAIINNNRILKVHTTLYEVDKLSNERLAALARHEFGHALGLAHSTAPEDLMAPVIKTDYPFITDCTIDAIDALYNGKQKSQVECQK